MSKSLAKLSMLISLRNLDRHLENQSRFSRATSPASQNNVGVSASALHQCFQEPNRGFLRPRLNYTSYKVQKSAFECWARGFSGS